MKIRYGITIAALVLSAACSVDPDSRMQMPAPDDSAIIVNTPDDARADELLIKFKPEYSDLLDEAFKTRSAACTRTELERSGITTVDELLAVVGSCRLERIFPFDRRHEERTRACGLHLWYTVHLDQSMAIEEVAERFAALGEISKIEYSKELKRLYTQPPVQATADAVAAIAARATRSADATGFDDPEAWRQWHFINSGSLSTDDGEVKNMMAGADVNCAEAWKKCTGDPSIIVAVMDEGVMWNHPDLEANMWINEGEIYRSDEDNDGNGYAGDLYGYNFAVNSNIISWDAPGDTGHGTHVAGTIAAVNNNSIGVNGIAGGSGNGDGVKIMSLQIFSGDYGITIPNEVRAIKYAADNGAVILQCSWGYNSNMANPVDFYPSGYGSDDVFERSQPVEFEAFEYFQHHAGSPDGVIEGGIIIFAAGNEFAPMASYPGAHKNFVSVAAVAGDYTPSTFSNYGIGVDISAPGGDEDYHESHLGCVYSTLPPTKSGGSYYGYMEGTSMACPHVSGVAALGLSYAAKTHRRFTSAEYQELLLRSVKPIDPYLTGTKLYNYNWSSIGTVNPTIIDLDRNYKGRMGSGITDAGLLLQNIESAGSPILLPNIYVAADGGSKTINAALCFDGGESADITVKVDNPDIAEAAVSGRMVTFTGKNAGSTRYTVTANGESQQAYITVRNAAGTNGWF